MTSTPPETDSPAKAPASSDPPNRSCSRPNDRGPCRRKPAYRDHRATDPYESCRRVGTTAHRVTSTQVTTHGIRPPHRPPRQAMLAPAVRALVHNVDDFPLIEEVAEKTREWVYPLWGGSLVDDSFLGSTADPDCGAIRFADHSHGDQDRIQLGSAAALDPPNPVLTIDSREFSRQQRVLPDGKSSMNLRGHGNCGQIHDYFFIVDHGLELPGHPPCPATGANVSDRPGQNLFFIVVSSVALGPVGCRALLRYSRCLRLILLERPPQLADERPNPIATIGRHRFHRHARREMLAQAVQCAEEVPCCPAIEPEHNLVVEHAVTVRGSASPDV